MAIGTSQAFRTQNLRLLGNLFDKNNFLGKKGYYLSSDEDGTRWIADPNETSGVFSGGILSATIGGSTFNVSAGVGQVVSRTVLPSGEVETTTTRITWNAQNNVALTYRTTNKFSYIYIDENGVLQQQTNSFTDSQYRNQIVLGVICHINLSTINLVTNKQNVVYGDSHRLYELMSTFGPIKRSGLAISAYNTGLSVSRGSGTVLLIGSNYTTYQFEPDSPTINAATPASICRVYRNGSGDFVFDTNGGSYYTVIDPTKYDDGSGILQTVNNNQWTVQKLFFFPSNPNDIIVYYGFASYNSLNDAFLAIENESFYEAQITAENAVFLGYILVRGGAANLSLIGDARFIQSGVSRNVIVGGGGAAGLVLDDLLDVQITNPSNSQFFVYENSSGLWKNITFNAVNPLVFSGLGTSVSLSLNYATASQPGGVSTSAQTFGGAKTFANDVIISGNLTVNGTTTTVDTQNLIVEDKNIELGVVASPTNLTADGGGITLKGTTDKTFNWVNATSSWTSSENLDLANTKTYKINTVDVLSSTTLGSGVINSSLTSVGTLNNLTVAGYAYLATTSGSVGIGTASPAAKLEISSGALRLSDAWQIEFGSGALTGLLGLSIAGNEELYMYVAGSRRLTINKNGNLGVGTANPAAKLQIQSGALRLDDAWQIEFGSGLTTGYLGSSISGSEELYMSVAGNRRLTIDKNGNVGIGNATPAYKLDVIGGNISTDSEIYSLGGRLSLYRSAGNSYIDWSSGRNLIFRTETSVGGASASEKVRIDTNGNVGIGTTNPVYKLDINGVTRFQDVVRFKNAAWNLSDDGQVRFYFDVSGRTYFGSGNGYEWRSVLDAGIMALTNSGNLGIGTITPLSRLDIRGSHATGYGILNIISTDTSIISIDSTGARDQGIRLKYNGADKWLVGMRDTNESFSFSNASDTRLVSILQNGVVGIGTTVPAAKLHLYGASEIVQRIESAGSRTYGFVVNPSWRADSFSIYDFNADSARLLITSAGRISIGGGSAAPNNLLTVFGATSIGSNYNVAAPTNGLIVEGSVGIGAVSPSGKFHVLVDGSSVWSQYIQTNNATIKRNSIGFFDSAGTNIAAILTDINTDNSANFGISVPNGSPRLTIKSDGNVGINTTSPSSLLDVRSGYITSGTASSTSGSTLITGYYTSGYLTSLATEFSSGGPVLGYAVSPSTSSTGAFLSSTGITIPRSAYVQDGGTHRWYIGPSQNVAIGNAVSASEVMRININGNVGIGTTNPLTRLSVGSGSLADGNIPIQTSSLGNGTERWIGVNKNGAYGLILGYYEGSSLSGLGAYVRQVTSDPLYFVVNNATTAMTMLSSGNVGIGTVTPAAKLDINGTTNFAANVYHSIGGQKFFAGSGGTYNYFYTGTTALNFLNSSDTATLMTILNGGSIGIGTTAPSTKLEVIGTVKATLFDGPINQVNVTADDSTNSSHYLYFGATNSGASIIKASTKIRFNPSTGAFYSTTKSFRIPHLTKSGYDLVYGSLESPYHGIRLTGKGKTNGNRAEVILPDYINVLVDKETVHIQLTPIKCAKILYIEDLFIDDNKFIVKYDKSWFEKAKDIEFYWDFTAERKDVPKLIVEEKI